MSNNDAIFHLRLNSDLRDEVDEHAADAGITSSEFVRNAIEHYMDVDQSDGVSVEEINDMDWDELCDLIDEHELEVDPADYDNSTFFSSPDADDTKELREAVLTELGLLDEISAELEAEEYE